MLHLLTHRCENANFQCAKIRFYSRGGNSGNACFVSLCSICAPILIYGGLHVIPYVSRCQNFWNFKNPSLTADIITILVKTTISELYQFFLADRCCKVWPWPGPFKGPDPWFLDHRCSCGMVAKYLRVSKSCVESRTLGQGYGGISCREGQDWGVWEEYRWYQGDHWRRWQPG